MRDNNGSLFDNIINYFAKEPYIFCFPHLNGDNMREYLDPTAMLAVKIGQQLDPIA